MIVNTLGCGTRTLVYRTFGKIGMGIDVQGPKNGQNFVYEYE